MTLAGSRGDNTPGGLEDPADAAFDLATSRGQAQSEAVQEIIASRNALFDQRDLAIKTLEEVKDYDVEQMRMILCITALD